MAPSFVRPAFICSAQGTRRKAGGEFRGAGGSGGSAAGPRAAMRGRVPAVYTAGKETPGRAGAARVDFGLANQDRGVSPPHGDVLLYGDKRTQKRLLLAEGMALSTGRQLRSSSSARPDIGTAVLHRWRGPSPWGPACLVRRYALSPAVARSVANINSYHLPVSSPPESDG